MSQFFEIHPETPQARLVRQSVQILRDGGVIAYPTDSAYALGCALGNKEGVERISAIRQLDKSHDFTLICRDLSELATYARVENPHFRLLKAYTPGPYTFILKATRETPRRVMHPKRKTVGLRVPENPIAHAILGENDEPMLTSTLIMPGDEWPLNDAEAIRERLGKRLDLVIDGGPCPAEPTTVVSLVEELPEVLRVGRGDPGPFRPESHSG